MHRSPARSSGSPLRVLRIRNFWPYFAGNLLSNCGTWFQNIAQAILVYRLTHSTFLVGVVNFAQFVGVFLLAPWAGSAADRFDRRRMLVVTQIVAISVTALLAVLQSTGRATTPVVIGLALLLGLTVAFAIPAIQAMVPDLVGPEDLAPAMAMSSLTFNLARAVGPVVGALVVAHWGIAVAFGLNSLSYLGLIGGLLVGAFGAGSALAAVTVAGRVRDPVRRLAPGCLLMGLGMLGFGLAPALPFAFGALAVGGFWFMVTNTAATTALTLEVAPEQRGRVMALWSLCFLGTRPAASLADGTLASAASLRVAAVALTVPVLAAAAAMAVLRSRVPRLRQIGIARGVMAEPPAPDVPEWHREAAE